MRLRVGTSGFHYDEWVGPFYPEGTPDDARLAYYGQRFETVEINNTFYRMPKREVLERWAAAVPPGFTFAIKASKRITHQGRLGDDEGAVGYLMGQLESLGDALGPLLFQTPPFLRKDVERLRALVGQIPKGIRAAFELRHASWDDPQVQELLSAAGHAVCIGELDEVRPDRPLPVTSSWGYLRLHVPAYDDSQLHAWTERIASTWSEAFVYFKHETTGPELARRMIDSARACGHQA